MFHIRKHYSYSRYVFIGWLAIASFFSYNAKAQGEKAIHNEVDTMDKYVPENNLATKVHIRHIIFEGNKVTKKPVLLREMSVREGDSVFSDSIPLLMNQNKLRLYNMVLFNDVDMVIEKVNKNEVDWRIKLKERWFIVPNFNFQLADRNFNVWWNEEHHDLSRTNIGITLTDINFRGTLENLGATVQLGYTRKFGLNYLIPYIDKKQKSGLGFIVSLAQSRQTYYASDSNKLLYVNDPHGNDILRQVEAGISYIYRPGYATRHIFTLTYKDYKVGDTVLQLNKNYYSDSSRNARLLELVYRFEYNNVDNWNYPLIGFKNVTYVGARAGFEGIHFQSYLSTEAGYFQKLTSKYYLSVIFRGRLMLPEKQPYAFLAGLGTRTDYVRGYEYYVVDGPQYGVFRFDLKREVFNNTWKNIPITYFTAFPLRIYPKIFADIGGIRTLDPGNSFLSNRILYAVGAGVDIITLYDIKIRLEFAYNHLKQNGLYLHFNSE